MTSHLRSHFEALVKSSRQILSRPGTKREVSLYPAFQSFFDAVLEEEAPKHSWLVLQQTNADKIGIPDFRIERGKERHGWIEVKAAEKELDKLKDRDKRQVETFQHGLANFIVTNGWEWRLFRDGERIAKATVGGDHIFDPRDLGYRVEDEDLRRLGELLTQFIDAPSIVYPDAAAAVIALASRARALRLALTDLGASGAGDWLNGLRDDFARVLFKNGQAFTWPRFVDSYVQLAVFGTLLWRIDSGREVDLTKQVEIDSELHPLLHQCLVLLWQPQARPELIEPLMEELCATVNLIEPQIFTRQKGPGYLPDPIIHAYEPFFKHYDAKSREEAGVFYTPAELVKQIVSGVDALLSSGLGLREGILAKEAMFLDPAVGTGTFLLGLIDQVAESARKRGWPIGEAAAHVLQNQCWAFELFPGPYTIAHQRIGAALKALGARIEGALPIYLADTLSAPEGRRLNESKFGQAGKRIWEERKAADQVKTKKDILVVFGNPPYERILGGKNADIEPFARRLFEILSDATPPKHRADLKSTWDLFVAFWLWAFWALQEPDDRQASELANINTRRCNGIVAYVTNRTWLVGNSLMGLRRLAREGAKEIWVYDLGGDARGSHGARSFAAGDDNVFPIMVGVAVVWVVFERGYRGEPSVRYRRLYGKRAHKLSTLAEGFDAEAFTSVSGTGTDPFIPIEWKGTRIRDAPTIHELFSDPPTIGIQTARDKSKYSPVGTDASEILARIPKGRLVGRLAEWAKLPEGARRSTWETAQKKRTHSEAPDPKELDPKRVQPFLYRPLDVRFVYDHSAWIDWYREDLHKIFANGPVPSLVTIPHDHGAGPAVIYTDKLMDQHAFRGSDGGNGVWHLWHTSGGSTSGAGVGDRRCGLSPLVLSWLEKLGRAKAPEAAFDYVLAVLSAPSYTRRFWRALEVDSLRVPLTDDVRQFDLVSSLGGQVRAAWGAPEDRYPGVEWSGTAAGTFGEATWDETGKIRFSGGRDIEGVPREAWRFEVSGYPLLPRWFEARQDWTMTQTHWISALSTVVAVRRMVDVGPALDKALENLLE